MVCVCVYVCVCVCRRVYDAINVLMATDIIQREKKEITWVGLPQGVKDLPCHSEQRPSSAPPSLGSVGATPMSVGSVGVNTGEPRVCHASPAVSVSVGMSATHVSGTMCDPCQWGLWESTQVSALCVACSWRVYQ